MSLFIYFYSDARNIMEIFYNSKVKFDKTLILLENHKCLEIKGSKDFIIRHFTHKCSHDMESQVLEDSILLVKTA